LYINGYETILFFVVGKVKQKSTFIARILDQRRLNWDEIFEILNINYNLLVMVSKFFIQIPLDSI